jgi:hypothetical protein
MKIRVAVLHAICALLACPTNSPLFGDEPCDTSPCDELACDKLACDELVIGNCKKDYRYRTPAMIGDFFGGSPLGFRADSTLDRLIVLANDLDAPLILPPNGSVLSISEPGPVGIFNSPLQSIQQLQTLLRAGSPVPGATWLEQSMPTPR